MYSFLQLSKKYLGVIILLFPFVYSIKSLGQSPEHDWLINIRLSLQKHDKRLFNTPEKETYLSIHPNFFGTYKIRVEALNESKFDQVLWHKGFGVMLDVSTFTRPFDHEYFDQDRFRVLRTLNNYKKISITIPNYLAYELNSKITFGAFLNVNFDIFTYANNSKSNLDVYPYSKWDFNFYSFEFTPEIAYHFNKTAIGFGIRALHLKKVDKVLFADFVDHYITNKELEFYNPLELSFRIKFKI